MISGKKNRSTDLFFDIPWTLIWMAQFSFGFAILVADGIYFSAVAWMVWSMVNVKLYFHNSKTRLVLFVLWGLLAVFGVVLIYVSTFFGDKSDQEFGINLAFASLVFMTVLAAKNKWIF